MKKSIQRAAIWIPNLSRNSGGAELYLLHLARILQEQCEVILLCDRCEGCEETVQRALRMHGMPDFEVRYVDDPSITDRTDFARQLLEKEQTQHVNIERLLAELDIDLFINGTYGTLCGFGGRRNWHIVHFPPKPFDDAESKAHAEEYLASYDHFLCNSRFTAEWFERWFGKTAEVLYPPIDAGSAVNELPLKKENLILTCGRITPAKKLREMISAFRRLNDLGITDYRFCIAGLYDRNQTEYLKLLQEEGNGLPVEIMTDLSREDLFEQYRKAKFYWHAMGLGVSDDNPLKMEHFGMTTAEAMAFGCVPVVIDRGGQKEIVTEAVGCRFSDEAELVRCTVDLIRDPERTERLSRNAFQSAKRYSLEQFQNTVLKYLSSAD